MLNMGGPETTDQVHDYLLRIMTDREMIQLPLMQEYVLYIMYVLIMKFNILSFVVN